MYLRLVSFFILYIGTTFSLIAQSHSFTSNCKPLADDSVVVNAFRNGCIPGWEAESGQPYLISSVVNNDLAALRSGESIILRKTFSRCSIYNITFKLKLKDFSQAQLELIFRDKSQNVFVQPYALKSGYATGWMTVLIHGFRLAADYESLSVSFRGQTNTVLIDEITIGTECAQNQTITSTNLSGKSQNQGTLNVSDSHVLDGDSLLLTSDKHVVLKDDVILTSGSEVVIKITPCLQQENDCLPEQPKEFSIFNFLSPNGDGQNDTFYIDGLEQFPDVEVSIVNKSGKQVFHSSAYKNDWNGGDQPVGIYTYQVRLKSAEKPLTGELLLTK